MNEDEEELLPVEEGDDEAPEDPSLLLAQLEKLCLQQGPASALLQVGQNWLRGQSTAEEVRQSLAKLESQLPDQEANDPLLSSQMDRLDEALQDGLNDQVLYALLGLGTQLKSG